MNDKRTWIRMHAVDNVATALDDLEGGIKILDSESGLSFTLTSNIPFGHKFAMVSIQRGSPIYKYGEVIGEASADIAAGEHVHVHNLVSLRGRGDLVQSEESLQ